MSDDFSLESILDKSAVIPDVPDDDIEDVASDEADTGEIDEGSPPEPEKKHERPPEGMVPTAALADERAKRQEAQRELDELRRKFAKESEKPAVSKEPEKEIDFLDDPDGWKNQIKQQLQAEVASARQESQARFLSLVENAARERHKDASVKFDDALQAFGAAAQSNPLLANEMLQAGDPAEYAYKAGKRLLMLSDAGGDLETLIERERAAAKAEVLAELQNKTSIVDDIPESLSKVTGKPSGPIDEPINLPLASIIKRKY